MNRKIALLMFAIGVGAASAPALAASCQGLCAAAYRNCISWGVDAATCTAEREECFEMC